MSPTADPPLKNFPVVCVGGSAGGLDAYTRLLQHLPADLGAAIVIVNHVRTMSTLLHEILPRYTTMPVELITERLVIEPNHVFIIPPQRDLHLCPRVQLPVDALILSWRQKISLNKLRELQWSVFRTWDSIMKTEKPFETPGHFKSVWLTFVDRCSDCDNRAYQCFHAGQFHPYHF